MTDEETIPHKARRLGREYGRTYHDRWSEKSRRWITFAYARGFQTACEEIADQIDALVDQWEEHGDQQRFADALSLVLNRYDTRGAGEDGAA